MDNHQKNAGAYSSSKNFDHLFGPKDSSSTNSSCSTTLFGSLFPPHVERSGSRILEVGCKNFGTSGTHHINKGESSSRISNKNTTTNNYQNETLVEPSYFSSSIYYGGQENYSPRSRTTQSQHVFKKDNGHLNNGNDHSDDASRGNWWQGSLYY